MYAESFDPRLYRFFTHEQLQSLHILPNLTAHSSLGRTMIKNINKLVKAEAAPTAFVLYGTPDDHELANDHFDWVTPGENVLGILWSIRGPKNICTLFTPTLLLTSLSWGIIVANTEVTPSYQYDIASLRPTFGLTMQITIPKPTHRNNLMDQGIGIEIKVANKVTGNSVVLLLPSARSIELLNFIDSSSW